MTRINSAAELEELRQGILSKKDPAKPSIAICAGLSCLGLGNGAVISAFKEELRKQSLEGKVDVIATGCHGFCEKGPIVVINPEEICYLEVKPEDAPEIISQTVLGKKVIDRLVYTDPNSGEKTAHMSEIPFYKNQMRVLMGNNAKLNPKSIDDYLAMGGYSALAKALLEMSPVQVLEEVNKANCADGAAVDSRQVGSGRLPAMLLTQKSMLL